MKMKTTIILIMLLLSFSIAEAIPDDNAIKDYFALKYSEKNKELSKEVIKTGVIINSKKAIYMDKIFYISLSYQGKNIFLLTTNYAINKNIDTQKNEK